MAFFLFSYFPTVLSFFGFSFTFEVDPDGGETVFLREAGPEAQRPPPRKPRVVGPKGIFLGIRKFERNLFVFVT